MIAASGSSPLTRGALQLVRQLRGLLGLIPAYAGSTPKIHRVGTDVAAHPRLRGEHMDVQRCLRKRNGSSPLTRGALRRRIGRAGWRRLIPAYAGSTQPVARQVVGVQAHPRLRGEHGKAAGKAPPTHGSSPLTRGAHLLTCTFPSLKSILDPT